MKLFTKQITFTNEKKIKKYYLAGFKCLVKEKTPLEKKLTLFGISFVYQRSRKSNIDLSSLFNQKQKIIKEIDIVVPVYNGYEFLDNLFIGIQKHTDLPYRLFVVNDCSPDDRVAPLLYKWKNIFNNKMILIENDTNKGFIKSVNRAIIKTLNDIVIINTDVILPSKWASRLFYPIFTDKKVASVTPFSNCATIFSLPKMGDNDFSGDLEKVNELISKLNIPFNSIQLPTGVGFCMAMSRKAIKKIGFFDERYGKGYGEENDWWQRAIKEGYYNTIAGDLFVWHKHGGSFLSDEKKYLIQKNSNTLLKKFPKYHKQVNKIVHDETFLLFRFIAEIFYFSAITTETQIWFDHTWGGGTEVYTMRKFNELKDNTLLIRVQDDGNHLMKLTYHCHDVVCGINIYKKDMLVLLENIQSNVIVVNNLAGYANISETLLDIYKLKKKTGAKISFRGHDLQCVCPTITMINSNNKYCDCDDFSNCEECFSKLKGTINMNVSSIAEWHDSWMNFFNKTADEIIVFSQSTYDIYKKYYPITSQKMTIIPHKTPQLRKVKVRKINDRKINVIVLGNIGIHKGYLILKEIDSMIGRYQNMNIIVVGKTCGPLKNIFITGSYETKDLPDIMERYKADIIFIPSIWHETFSYTTSEGISMGLPVACFDLGAPAERVRKYEKGLIISKIDAETALQEIEEFISKRMN